MTRRNWDLQYTQAVLLSAVVSLTSMLAEKGNKLHLQWLMIATNDT